MKPPMPSESRWQKAQQYERAFWERSAGNLRSGGKDSPDGWYRWKAGEMEKHLAGLLPEERKRTARVLEVGCGPAGIVSFMGWGERHAVDPLDDFYSSQEVFTRHRDPSVRYQKAMGEKLPFPDKAFELVILQNVLDHVQQADKLLQEIHRVLTDAGLFYMTVNVRAAWGTSFHSVLSRLLIDKGHPYSFTVASIRRFLAEQGFVVRHEFIEDHGEARRRERSSPSLRDKIKGYTGLTEFVFYSVCSKAQ